jgi:DNA polymerase III subunit alpha
LQRYGCFDEAVVEQARQAIVAKAPVLIRAELVWRPGEEMPRVNARDIKPLDNFADKITACLTITLKGPGALADLHALSQSHLGGRGKMVLRAHLGNKIASLTLPHLYKVDDNLRDIVRHLPDVVSAELL